MPESKHETKHEMTVREAGRKGGEAVSRNREHMSQIGRKGGEARADKGAEPRSRERQ